MTLDISFWIVDTIPIIHRKGEYTSSKPILRTKIPKHVSILITRSKLDDEDKLNNSI